MIIDNPDGKGYYCTRCGKLYMHPLTVSVECRAEKCERKEEDLPGAVEEYREQEGEDE